MGGDLADQADEPSDQVLETLTALSDQLLCLAGDFTRIAEVFAGQVAMLRASAGIVDERTGPGGLQ